MFNLQLILIILSHKIIMFTPRYCQNLNFKKENFKNVSCIKQMRRNYKPTEKHDSHIFWLYFKIREKKYYWLIHILIIFTVHIVADSPEECDLYSEHINVINAVSRIQNIKIIPSSNYVQMKNSLYDEATKTCSIFLVVEVRHCHFF